MLILLKEIDASGYSANNSTISRFKSFVIEIEIRIVIKLNRLDIAKDKKDEQNNLKQLASELLSLSK